MSQPSIPSDLKKPQLSAPHMAAQIGTQSMPDDEDGIDLKEVAQTVWDGRWWIAAIVALSVLLAATVTLFSHMSFQATSSLFLGDTQKSGDMPAMDGMSSIFSGFSNSEMGNELEILKSRDLVMKTILELGTNAQVRGEAEKMPRMFTWLANHRDLRLLKPAPSMLRARFATVTLPEYMKKPLSIQFLAGGKYQIRDTAGALIGDGMLNKPFRALGLSLVLTPSSGDFIPASGARYVLSVSPAEDAYNGMMNQVSASIPKGGGGKELNIIQLQYTSASPYLAAEFLNQLMRDYLIQHLAWKTEEASSTEGFINTQLDKVHQSLSQAEQRLANYKKQSGVVLADHEAKAMIDQIANYETQRTSLRLQIYALGSIESVLKRPGTPVEAFLLSQVDDPVLTGMSENLAKGQQELKSLTDKMTPDAPPVEQQRALLEKQQSMIRGYIGNKRRVMQENLDNLNQTITGFDTKLKSMPDAEMQIVALTRSAEVLGKLYVLLLQKQEETTIAKAATISKSRVLTKALVPSKEIAPKLTFTLIQALIIGLFLGVVLVYGRHRLARGFRSESEIRQRFAEVPLFGTVPHYLPSRERKAGGFKSIMEEKPQSIQAESFRLLRTNLYYSGAASWDRIILLTSSAPEDGKTTTALNLAYALALDGKKVLIIDGDLRKPSHHLLLGLTQHPGFSSILTGEKHWKEVMQPIFDGKVDIITTGILPPNPAELLSTPRLGEFLAEAKHSYDFVLLDSPPFPLVSDAMILAHHADWVFTILRVGNSPRRPAEEHVRRLSTAVQHYGLIINDIASNAGGYGYAYGYQYGYGDQPNGAQGKPTKKLWRRLGIG